MASSSHAQDSGRPELAPLLNHAVLQLSPELRTTVLPSKRVVVKYEPGRRYLVLAPQQWALLEGFAAGRTVTQVLCATIAAQRCPSLREFYELVVKAVGAGVLQTAAHPAPPADPPARWALRLNGTFLRWTTALIALGAGASLLLFPVRWTGVTPQFLLGWLVAYAGATLGWFLAAGVVRGAGAGVYHPRFRWKSPVPRFTVDLDDALMAGKAVQVNAALTRLLPLLLLAGLVAWRLPDMLLPQLATLLVLLTPVGGSPVRVILQAQYGDPPLATSVDMVFAPEGWLARWRRARQQLGEGSYLWVGVGAMVGWLLLVFLLACGLLRSSALDLLRRFNAVGGWRYAALVVLGFLLLLVLLGVVGLVLLAYRGLRDWARARAERRLRPAAVLVSPATIAEWLGRTVLFHDLAPADLVALAGAVKPEEHRRGSYVVREGEPGERLYVVLSGRLEVRRDLAPGKSVPVAEVVEGDVFGEVALLQGGVRTRSIRAREKSILLGLDRTDFERLVLPKLSRAAVAEAVQKVGFLTRTELAKNWNQATVAAFAARAQLREYAEGETVMQEGANNHWFFLVHRGELTVRQKGRELRTLQLGESFGETSLLGDGIATATVIVRSKVASCLVINGRDFVDFMTRDFTVGLGWEEDVRKRPLKT